MEGFAAAHSPSAEVWLGETGHAQCGGEPGVSDRYITGFWWLDELGQMAARGQQITMRQALIGGSYTLLRPDGLVPTPDFFNSVLWQRLMGDTVLQTTSSDPMLRAYAHCTRGQAGAVTLLLLNLDPARAATIEADAHIDYVLTAPDLLSETTSLNGTLLEVASDGVVPETPGVLRRGPIEIGPRSYGFFVLPGAEAAACR